MSSNPFEEITENENLINNSFNQEIINLISDDEGKKK